MKAEIHMTETYGCKKYKDFYALTTHEMIAF